jgi:hypothetical protein
MKRLILVAIIAVMTMVSSNQVFADEWEPCAREHQDCMVPGTKVVRYGAGNRWTQIIATNRIHCGNNVFGDPAPGVKKACYYQDTEGPRERHHGHRPHWEKCANERQYCEFRGQREVRYGAGDSWNFRTVRNGVSCENNVFGDPAYGVKKACYIKVD